MDDKWFKSKQKLAGVTAEAIAKKMGRDRTVVSKIYSGNQRMSLPWAKAFAEVLNVPLDVVLEKSGATDRATAKQSVPGYSDGDAIPWVGQGGDYRQIERTASNLGADRPGVDVWRVNSDCMALGGVLPGDYFLLDTHESERVKAGDLVIAQVYNNHTGIAETLLRRYQPPVLLSANLKPEDQGVHFVDGNYVVIRGKVIASWRMM